MTACLVWGASGAVGRFLLPRLLAQGASVLAVSRHPPIEAAAPLRWLVGDLDQDLAPPAGIDQIFSCGPLDAFARWYARSATGTAGVVALGSMSAHSKLDSPDPAERAVSARLREAEQVILHEAAARGAAAVLLRPTLIYGAGIDRSLTPIARFARRWRVYPRLLGASGLRQPVHADDLAMLCIAAAGTVAAAGLCYEAGGGERLSLAAMIARSCASLDVHCIGLPLPLPLLHGLVPLAAVFKGGAVGRGAFSRLREDLLADNGPAQRDLGWKPRRFEPDAANWLGTGPVPDYRAP